jgi:hypothetical protein
LFYAVNWSESGTTSGTSKDELLGDCKKLPFFKVAGVAELVDAADSKSAFRKEVWVRVPPPVPSFFKGLNLLQPLIHLGFRLLDELGEFGNIV